MTQEDKELLLKDLCARLPYGVQVSINDKIITTLKNLKVTHFYNDTNNVQDVFAQVDISDGNDFVDITSIKPYLRPMSSMTEEEEIRFQGFKIRAVNSINIPNSIKMIDWFYEHHFDFRGLIPMGLSLEAPKDMYKTDMNKNL